MGRPSKYEYSKLIELGYKRVRDFEGLFRVDSESQQIFRQTISNILSTHYLKEDDVLDLIAILYLLWKHIKNLS